MNDSFLEELDLIPKVSKAQSNPQLNNRFITTRKILTPPQNLYIKKNYDNAHLQHDKIISSSCSNLSKGKTALRSGNEQPRKLSGPDPKPLSSTPKSERRSQGDENLIKPIENQLKVSELKSKQLDVKVASKSAKGRRCSGSSAGSGKYLDASSKENTRPSIDSSSSRESGPQVEQKKNVNRRTSDGVLKKVDILEKTDPVMLLSAIKDLISRYTEQETVKVLRAMQNLHMNSQTNLIKYLMLQTDELVKELNFHKNSGTVKSLIEENEKMRQDIFILRTRNEALQKKVDEMSLIKEENITLKLKLKELQQ